MKRFLPALAGTLLVVATLPAATPAFAAAQVVIINLDAGTGQGYDDPAPRAPAGGNPGVTLGQQRLIVAQRAADIWGGILDSPVPIFVLATFQPLNCTPTAATLGSAGTTFVFRDFPPGPPVVRPLTWYHSSLADKLSGIELNPGFGDIFSQFNSRIGTDPNCLVGADFYYGLDNNEGPGGIDFLTVVLHEIGHGLGFSNFVNEATGANFGGLTDIYSVFTLDNTTGKLWADMTDAERQASAVNTGNVVWSGPEVTGRTDRFLGRRPLVQVLFPDLGTFEAQAASFGPPLSDLGVIGAVALVDDGVGVGSDACEPIAANLSGRIALIDRGACAFAVKAENAQTAGAVAAIIANNVAGGPAPVGGTSSTVVIPTVGITLDQGNALKGALPVVIARLRLSPDLLAGADGQGRARLFAPNPAQLGSSISHFDSVASPNLLMEPAINADLRSAETLDLTPFQMLDVGWSLMDGDGDGVVDVEDECLGSDTAPTVVIDGCDTGVGNAVGADGCTISDDVAACAAGAGSHGRFVSCVARLAAELRFVGTISGRDTGRIVSCAARADIP